MTANDVHMLQTKIVVVVSRLNCFKTDWGDILFARLWASARTNAAHTFLSTRCSDYLSQRDTKEAKTDGSPPMTVGAGVWHSDHLQVLFDTCLGTEAAHDCGSLGAASD